MDLSRRGFLGAIMAATLAGLSREVARLRAEVARRSGRGLPVLARLRADPARILTLAGMQRDPWQEGLLRSPSRRMLLLCSRQAGKSLTAAALALRDALLRPQALVLLLSPTLRQSGELFRDKVMRLYNALGRPVKTAQESALTMTLANGSRVVSLPGDEETIRGYSGVTTLIVDEAARVLDPLYLSVRPMLAVSQGQLVCLSTPFGRRGWFFETWHGDEPWQRVKITADQCPRIPAEFLAEELKALGERWYRQEYLCSFEETVDSVFTYDDIMAAKDDGLIPLFAGGWA
jgi:hypothetical protein